MRHLMAAALGAALVFTAATARAEDPAYLTPGIGIYDVFHDDTAGDFSLEYRADRLWFLHPKAGMEATTDGAFYVYGGFNFDIPVGERIVLTLGTAVGHYSNGGGKDLGDPIEFKSGAEIALRLKNRVRIGLGLHHISNAGIGDDNPGTEVLGLTYSIPMGRLFQTQSASRR
ncbi:MAG TPA: acyloxyacyl hydrolase [Alphaproteobacteria bacterium]|nr:acyloxyacyl hydrolase [Alphaproteobacteria bacterium]